MDGQGDGRGAPGPAEAPAAPAPGGGSHGTLPDLACAEARGGVEIAARARDERSQSALARAVGGPAIDAGLGGRAETERQEEGDEESKEAGTSAWPQARRAAFRNGSGEL